MEKHQTYYNLLEALEERGCPICFLVAKSVHNIMDDLLYEKVNDPGVRKDIRESHGFCNTHAWQMQKSGDSFGISLLYEDIISYIPKKMLNIKNIIRKRGSYHENIKLVCPLCRVANESMERYVLAFVDYFNDLTFRQKYKDSFGLCIPHLVEVLKSCKDNRISTKIIDIEHGKLSSIGMRLNEFSKRYDYRFIKDGFGREEGVCIEVIEKMIGKEGIY